MADQVTQRAVGTAGAFALAELASACVTVTSAGPASAGVTGATAVGSSAGCPSLRKVIAFEGWVTVMVGDAATGASPPGGKCPSDENPKFSTPSSFSWDLKPIFKKGAK